MAPGPMHVGDVGDEVGHPPGLKLRRSTICPSHAGVWHTASTLLPSGSRTKAP